MSRQFLGKPILVADNTSPSAIFQEVEFTDNIILEAARVMVLYYNAPIFTDLYLRVYGERSGAPGKLIATSVTTYAPLDIDPGNIGYAHKEIYFQFSPQIRLRAGLKYYFTLELDNYTAGLANKHLAWATQYPDPYYATGVTILQTKAAKMPYAIHFVGSIE